MASANICSCVESARQNIVSFIGLFCKRDLSFYWVASASVLSCLASAGAHALVATLSRLLQIIGLFCKRALLKRRYPAEETFIEI